VINKSSLRHQFKKQLAISIGLLVVIFSFLLDQLFFIGINTTMHRTMMSMANHYAEQIEQNGQYDLPHKGAYSVYVGKEDIPTEISTLFDFNTDKDFMVSVNGGDKLFTFSKPESIYFLFALPLANTPNKLYLLYNDSPPKGLAPPKNRGPLLNVPISIVFIILLAIFTVYWIARRLINRVINPLNELTDMANSLDESSPELSFKVMNDKTEIGIVANTLHQTMGRIHQYHLREKQFLQNASHELRTPIAVVSSALDIIDLRASQNNFNIEDQHIHIRRANKNMAEITNALLLLSRNDSSNTSLEKVNLAQLVESTINEHRYLLEGKNVDVEFIEDERILFEIPKALCQITISNLIRNAFEHTLIGTVIVHLEGFTVSITNTGSGLSDNFERVSVRGVSDGQGFGIGLDIVRQIAEQQSWQLQVSSNHDNGSQVVISFAHNKGIS
jgi:signal transduction histidine kinase